MSFNLTNVGELNSKGLYLSIKKKLERFSHDLEMKTGKQNRKNKRTEIERYDWFIERIQTRVAFG